VASPSAIDVDRKQGKDVSVIGSAGNGRANCCRCCATHRRAPGTEDQAMKVTRQESFDSLQGLQLRDAIDFALAEARMVLPGIQAIFGFQLIVTFNERFAHALAPSQQALHLAALILTGIAMALVLTPAAYHRRVQRESVSSKLLDVTSRMVSSAMIVLAIGLALDLYVVTVLVTRAPIVSGAVALTMLGLFFALWIVYPGLARR